jgi:RNA polymerase sigma-70 factor (ECF subfamily)
MDEPQAIAQLKQGDLTGLEFFVRQYQAKAIHTAYLIIGDTDLAEDIVQIAFLRIVQRIDQFDSQRLFQPWFLRAVINDAIKAAQRQQRTVSINTTTQATLDWLRDTTGCVTQAQNRKNSLKTMTCAKWSGTHSSS